MSEPNEKPRSQKEIFLELAQPDCDGYSRAVSIEELIACDERFRTSNGCGWARSDGPLGREYHVVREHKGGRVVSVKLDGLNYNPRQKGIRSEISSVIRQKPCAVLAINSNIECDHKNGRYDNRAVGDPQSQRLEDFQPLSKAANDAKRQHCKQCHDSGRRFDATVLGYRVGYIKGSATSPTCVGCYWNDPLAFNRAMSEHFHKTV